MIAGFITGFAGFGTGLVASGLWFHALPAHAVPPLVVLASVAAQFIALAAVRRAFLWRRAAPYLAGGLIGAPLGVLALSIATPGLLRGTIGALLVAYCAWSWLAASPRPGRIAAAGPAADAAVGGVGGFLGGFAGLSGPVPLIWLQLKGGGPDMQRATYQPFNLVTLIVAGTIMGLVGRLDGTVLTAGVASLPATLIGAWMGSRAYGRVDAVMFRRVVLSLLCVSGVALLLQELILPPRPGS